MKNLSSCKKPMIFIFYTTPNAPKSFTMQIIWVECLNQCQCVKRILRGQLNLTLLHHCRPSILSLQHMSLNLFSVFHSNSLVAHYYSYNLPFSESPQRLWLRDYLTPYCDPWQPYFRLRLFVHFQDSFQGSPFRHPWPNLRLIQVHLSPFRHLAH